MKPKARAKAKPKLVSRRRSRVEVADELCRDLSAIRARDGRCEDCRSRPWSDTMHGFGKKAHPNLMFTPDNLLKGCRRCHRAIDADKTRKREVWISNIGAERYEALRLRSLLSEKLDIDLVIADLYVRIAENRKGTGDNR